ncbi:MAG: PilZ domain-containing protein [Chloroflexota bacterium]
MEDNRRRERRKYLTYFSRVTDHESGIMVGYLVDLTTGGAQLVGNIPLDLQIVYDLRVDLPEDFFVQGAIEIQARAVWIQPDIDPEFYRIGLQLVTIAPSDLLVLQKLLNTYAANP